MRGQYGPGTMADKQVIGYRQEEGVNPDSKTETFAAMKLFVDNWRFAEVPFYLRSGKRMASKVTEISIQFKRVPHLFFHLSPDDQMEPNVLTMRIAPDEGISLKFGAKMPGPGMHLRQVQMNFNYSEAFHVEPATAYETLLLDAMIGDPTLFNRADVVEMAWGVIEPVLDIWRRQNRISRSRTMGRGRGAERGGYAAGAGRAGVEEHGQQYPDSCADDGAAPS